MRRSINEVGVENSQTNLPVSFFLSPNRHPAGLRELANLQRNGGDQAAAVVNEGGGVVAGDISGSYFEPLSGAWTGNDRPHSELGNVVEGAFGEGGG